MEENEKAVNDELCQTAYTCWAAFVHNLQRLSHAVSLPLPGVMDAQANHLKEELLGEPAREQVNECE